MLSGYSGRLNQEIRIKRGLSYGARSSLDARRETGPFVASAQTKNLSGAEVASLLVGELGRLSNEPIKETELVPRKAVLVGGFGRALETMMTCRQIASLALHGLKLDESRLLNNVQSITAAMSNALPQLGSTQRCEHHHRGKCEGIFTQLQARFRGRVIAFSDLD